MKILCIGNSFSQDATRYLSRIGKAAGTGIKTVNLYIGGCPLKTHYFNILEDQPAYAFEFNGENTGIKVSIKTALMSDEWDVVTLQQVSHQAPRYNTYQPYLNELAAYVRKYAPHTKIYMHQTWAYEDGSDRLCKELGYKKSTEMLEDIKASYLTAAHDINAAGIIPSGEAMMKALENGIGKVHRDTFHASLGAGRYLLGLTWYAYLTGNGVNTIPDIELDEQISAEQIEIIKRSVEQTVKR